MSVGEYIIKQEGDVSVGSVSLQFTAEDIGRAMAEGMVRSRQVGFLVLTNRNLYFVVTGFAEGFVASELAAMTPFGIGRKVITGKKLSLNDVYKNLKNPGSITIPLKDVKLVQYHKPPLSGAQITVGHLTGGKFRAYTFMFKGFSGKEDWKKAIEEWVMKNGGRTDGAPPPDLPDICPDCGSKMGWVPLAYRYYCPQCRQFK